MATALETMLCTASSGPTSATPLVTIHGDNAGGYAGDSPGMVVVVIVVVIVVVVVVVIVVVIAAVKKVVAVVVVNS